MPANTSNVVVTGGAGFVGSAVARQLVESGWRVVVLDNLSRGYREALPVAAEFVEGDATNPHHVHRALQAAGPSACVVHLAGLAYVSESLREPARYFHTNATGTLCVAEAAVQHGCAAFVLSSSCTVYSPSGYTPSGYSPSAAQSTIAEDSPLGPNSPYGESKLHAERVLHWMHRAHNLPAIALRYFNAAGAWGAVGERESNRTRLIPHLLRAADQGFEVDVYGWELPTRDGTCERDYIHVRDIAIAHLAALNSLVARPRIEALNLGTGRGATVREVARAVEEVTGRSVSLRRSPPREGDAPAAVAAPERAERVLGWKAEHSSLIEMVRDAWDFFRRLPRD